MNITLWVATGCNLSCKYCYETNKVSSLMTEDTVDNTFVFIKNEMAQQNDTHLSIQFHGGEPLLNMEIIKYATVTAKQFFPSLLQYICPTFMAASHRPGTSHCLSCIMGEQ